MPGVLSVGKEVFKSISATSWGYLDIDLVRLLKDSGCLKSISWSFMLFEEVSRQILKNLQVSKCLRSSGVRSGGASTNFKYIAGSFKALLEVPTGIQLHFSGMRKSADFKGVKGFYNSFKTLQVTGHQT